MSHVHNVFVREYLKRWHIFVLVLLMLVVITGLGFVTPYIYKIIVDKAIPDQDVHKLVILASTILLCLLIQPLLALLQGLLFTKLSLRCGNAARRYFFNITCELDLNVVYSIGEGQLLARLKNDVNGYNNFISRIITDAVTITTTMITSVVLMYSLNAKLLLYTLPILTLIIVLSWLFQKRLTKAELAVRNANSGLLHYLSDIVNAIKAIRSLAASGSTGDILEHKHNLLVDSVVKSAIISSILSGLVGLTTMAPYPLVLGLGGYQVIKGNMTIGGMIMFLMLINRVSGPLKGFASIWIYYASAQAPLMRLKEVFENATCFPNTLSIKESPTCDLEMVNVSYAYESNAPCFSEVNYILQKEKMYGLIGKSGCGKSTLLELIAGIRKCTSGHIKIGDNNIYHVQSSERRKLVTLVTKPYFFLPMSIRDNLLLGVDDASDEMLYQALKTAQIDTFVRSFPDGLDYFLTMAANSFSLGEASRLSIARSLLLRPQYLLLDEATSCLDQDMEFTILENIRRNYPHTTAVIVTHRLETLKAIDEILILSDNKLCVRHCDSGSIESPLLSSYLHSE